MQQENLEFYSAASQLIPLLFITFLVERHFQGEKGLGVLGQTRSVLQVLALISVFVMGEVAALQVLADGEPTESKESLVVSSLAVGTFLIVAPYLIGFAREMSDKAGDVMEAVVGLTLVIAVVVLISFV